jgi:serine/threonine-protein kinase
MASIGHYEIVTELGRGGMGVVYKGYEAALNRYVAIKMLSPALAHDEAIKERFLREARSMAALNDPHIIQVYFIGEQDGQPYFAMEFVEGESLSTYLKREGRLSPEQAARVIYQTALGLATAHDKGVVHRDIKPGNLMLTGRGQVKIADFGIALSQHDFSKKLTSTGEFVGTPGYLSPEVCTGQPVDLRSDIFSLGIVLFEMLTGRMPFTDESPLGLLLEVVRAEIPDVRELNADVDPELTRILKRMTEKDPAARYASCHELAADLARHPLVAGGNTVSAKPVLSPAAATVVGMKTPAPQAFVTPPPAVPRQPTPAPQPVVAAAPPPAPAPAPATVVTGPTARPSVLEAQQQAPRRESKTGALIAVAAMVLLAVGAGAFVALNLRGGNEAPAAVAALTTDAGDTNTTTAATANASTAATTSDTTTAASAQPSTATDAGAAATTTTATTASDTAYTAASDAATPAGPDADAGATATHTGIAAADATDHYDDSAAADSDSEALGPLRRMAEQRKAELAAAQGGTDAAVVADDARPRAEERLARREERREAAPVRPAGPPRIAVIGFGDPAVTGPARQMVEESLENQGFLLVDTDTLDFQPGDLARALAGAGRHNIAAIVAIRAEPLGSTQLNYYGQSDTMYSANVTVRPYRVSDRSPLSAGIRAKVDFTALNADYNTREALGGEMARVIGALQGFRPRG